jgi:hypothetical protein
VELTGTGLLADDLYLLAHHDVTGKPFVHRRALGLGLAGALLAELIFSDRVTISMGLVLVADRTLPRDELACIIVGLLTREHQEHQLRDWLTVLSAAAARDVPIRLARPATWSGVPVIVPGNPPAGYRPTPTAPSPRSSRSGPSSTRPAQSPGPTSS